MRKGKYRIFTIIFLAIFIIQSIFTNLSFADNNRNSHLTLQNSIVTEDKLIYNEKNGHYYMIIEENMNWDDAKNYCEDIGGYLATITDEAEQEFVHQLINAGQNSMYFIGGEYNYIKNDWQWITGEEFAYTNWADGEPNEDFNDTEDCIIIIKEPVFWNENQRGRWNDQRKFDLRYGVGFVCEFESDIDFIEDKVVRVKKTKGGKQISITLKNYNIAADNVVNKSNGVAEYSGNVSINEFLKVDGKVTCDLNNLTLKGNGLIYVETTSPYYKGSINLYKGDFEINGSLTELIKKNGIDQFQIAGMDVGITNLQVYSDRVEIGGKLSLPEAFGDTDINLDNIIVSKGKVDVKGEIKVNKLKLGTSSMSISDANMTFNSIENRFSGSGTLNIPNVFGIEGKIGFKNAKINEVGFGLDGLNLAIGSSGLYLQRLYGELAGMAEPPLSVIAETDISAGPKVGDAYSVLGKDLNITVNETGYVSGSGNIEIFSALELLSAGFEVDRLKSLKLTGSINIEDVIKANAEIGVSREDIYSKADARIQVPEGIPFIGGKGVDGEISINKEAVTSSIDIGRASFGVVYSFSDKKVRYNTNLDLTYALYVSHGNPISLYSANDSEILKVDMKYLEIPEGYEQALVYVRTNGQNSDFKLYDPDGNEIYKDSENYFINETTSEAVYILDNPISGIWSYELEDSTVIDYNIGLNYIVPKAELHLDIIDKINENKTIEIEYNTNSNGTNLKLYYDDLTKGINDIYIGSKNISSSDLNNKYVWDLSNVSSGSYRIYGVAEDGIAPNTINTIDYIIDYINENAPTNPEIIDVASENGNLNVSWNKSLINGQESDYINYIVNIFDEEDKLLKTIDVGSKTEILIGNLETDKYYSIGVIAIKDGIESDINKYYNAYLRTPTPPKVTIEWPKYEVNSKGQIRLDGIVESYSKANIYCNEKLVEFDIEGEFNVMIPISLGENRIKVRAENSYGDIFEEERVFFSDMTPPQLILDNLKEELYLDTSSINIIGKTEASAVVTVNGVEVTKDEDGNFEYSLALNNGVNKVEIIAEDYSKNRTVFEGKIYVNTLKLISSYPKESFEFIQFNKEFKLIFDENINKDERFDDIKLIDENGNIMKCNNSINSNILTVSHNDLDFNRNYTLIINKDSVSGENGEKFVEDYNINFKTAPKNIDLDNSGDIDIVDISNVALIYNTVYGNNNWDEKIDINEDKIIDIYDISIISAQI